MPPGLAGVIITIFVPATIVVRTSKRFLRYFYKKSKETRQLLNSVHLIITSVS
jgi:inactivated superfamily I helicase